MGEVAWREDRVGLVEATVVGAGLFARTAAMTAGPATTIVFVIFAIMAMTAMLNDDYFDTTGFLELIALMLFAGVLFVFVARTFTMLHLLTFFSVAALRLTLLLTFFATLGPTGELICGGRST